MLTHFVDSGLCAAAAVLFAAAVFEAMARSCSGVVSCCAAMQRLEQQPVRLLQQRGVGCSSSRGRPLPKGYSLAREF